MKNPASSTIVDRNDILAARIEVFIIVI